MEICFLMSDFSFAHVFFTGIPLLPIAMKSIARQVAFLMSGLLFLTTVYAALNTVVPLWLKQHEFSTSLIGVASAAFFVGNLVGTLAAGRIISGIGYGMSYLGASLLCVLTTLCLIPVDHIVAWLGVRFVGGISCALVWVIVESALLRLGTGKSRGKLLAAYMAVYYTATVIAQLLITALPESQQMASLWLAGIGALALIPMLGLKFDPPEALRPMAVIWAMLVRKRPRLSILGSVSSGILLGTIYGIMPLFLAHQGFSKSWVGYWMALLVAAGIVGQWPLGRLGEVRGRFFVLKLQSLLIVFACMLLVLDVGLAGALLLLGCAGFSLYPVTLALGCDRLPKDYLVPMNQTLLLSFTIGTLVGPLCTSFLMDHIADFMMPLCLAGVALFYWSLLVFHEMRHNHVVVASLFKKL